MLSTYVSSSARGTCRWLRRLISCGSRVTTRPSPATIAPCVLPDAISKAATPSSTRRSSHDSQCIFFNLDQQCSPRADNDGLPSEDELPSSVHGPNGPRAEHRPACAGGSRRGG